MIRYLWGVIFVCCLLPGCKKNDPLVGKWTMRVENGSAEMELAKDHTLRFGENNGTWQRADGGNVLLTMKSGVYTAEVRGAILNFTVGDRDVVFTKN